MITNLILILDGLGYDQIAYFSPPYLTKLGEQIGLIPAKTLLAYSSGIYPAIYSGLYPDESGIWTEFIKRDIPREKLTSHFRHLPGKFLSRGVAYIWEVLIGRLSSNSQYDFIPPSLQKWFTRLSVHYEQIPPLEFQSPKLITNLFTSAGKKLGYFHYDKLNVENVDQCIQRSSDVDTVIICIAETDHFGHLLGPKSKAFGEALFDLDNRLSKLFDRVNGYNPKLNLYIFSDHGMTSVTQSFNVWEYLEKSGYKLGKDYIAFINSTIMSLWYHQDNKKEIRRILNGCGMGYILNDGDLKRHHLNFNDRRYGDDFFIVNEGVELIPNFLSLARMPNIGMHGYLPEYPSTHAFLIGSNLLSYVPNNVVELYDFLASLANS